MNAYQREAVALPEEVTPGVDRGGAVLPAVLDLVQRGAVAAGQPAPGTAIEHTLPSATRVTAATGVPVPGPLGTVGSCGPGTVALVLPNTAGAPGPAGWIVLGVLATLLGAASWRRSGRREINLPFSRR
jgi:hypothetical protein